MQKLRRQLLLDAFRVADALVMSFAFAMALVTTAETASPQQPRRVPGRGGSRSRMACCSSVSYSPGISSSGCGASTGLAESASWSRSGGTSRRPLRWVPSSSLPWQCSCASGGGPQLPPRLLPRFARRHHPHPEPPSPVARRGATPGRNLRNLVIVGCGPRGALWAPEIWKRPELGYMLLGYIDDFRPRETLCTAGGEVARRFERCRGRPEQLGRGRVMICLPLRSSSTNDRPDHLHRVRQRAGGAHAADFFELKL